MEHVTNSGLTATHSTQPSDSVSVGLYVLEDVATIREIRYINNPIESLDSSVRRAVKTRLSTSEPAGSKLIHLA